MIKLAVSGQPLMTAARQIPVTADIQTLTRAPTLRWPTRELADLCGADVPPGWKPRGASAAPPAVNQLQSSRPTRSILPVAVRNRSRSGRTTIGMRIVSASRLRANSGTTCGNTAHRKGAHERPSPRTRPVKIPAGAPCTGHRRDSWGTLPQRHAEGSSATPLSLPMIAAGSSRIVTEAPSTSDGVDAQPRVVGVQNGAIWNGTPAEFRFGEGVPNGGDARRA